MPKTYQNILIVSISKKPFSLGHPVIMFYPFIPVHSMAVLLGRMHTVMIRGVGGSAVAEDVDLAPRPGRRTELKQAHLIRDIY